MCYIFWMHMEDIECGCLNNEQSCYEIAYSFGLGTDGEQNQQYMENAGQKYLSRLLKYCVQNITLFWQPFPMCIYLKMPFCHDLLFPKHFFTVSFPYLEEGEELNFLHPNFQKKKIKSISHFHTLLFHFQANKATF